MIKVRVNLICLVLGFFLVSCSSANSDENILVETNIIEEIIVPEKTGIRLIFTGDIMVHKNQLDIAKMLGTEDNPYNFEPAFIHVNEYLKGDIVIGNYETTSRGKGPYRGYPSFNSPDSLAQALKKSNFDVLFLANNHILDWGPQAGLRTNEYLKSLGFYTAGIGETEAELPIVEVKGFKIGFINRTYGSNYPLTEKVKELVHIPLTTDSGIPEDVQHLLDAGCDYIVAGYHFGPEYRLSPAKSQKVAAEISFNAGVDAIIGTHPHVLQPMELLENNGKTQFVAWSLGNFISSQRTLPRERTVILALDLQENEEGKLEPVKISAMPLWVDMVKGERIRILPTRLYQSGAEDFEAGFASEEILTEIQNTPSLQNKLKTVHEQVLEFLNLSIEEENGFHTLWEKNI